MRTSTVIGVVLMTALCIAPTALAEEEPQSQIGEFNAPDASCVGVDTTKSPPAVYTYPCSLT